MAEEQEVAPSNVRGEAKLAFLGRIREGKLPVTFRDGVTIGPNSTELSVLARHLGRDANLLPFHFLKWPLVDVEYKDRVMMEIKRIANNLDKVPEDQWIVLVEYWENPKTVEKIGKNILNCKRPKIMHAGGSKSFMKHTVEDQMKELADKATDEGSSIYSIGHDDIFTQVMGPDSRGRKQCFGRATFSGELLNTASNRDNAEVRNLKGKVVDVEEELKSTKEELKNTQQQCSDMKTTTNALQDSLKATMDELAMMRGVFSIISCRWTPVAAHSSTKEFNCIPPVLPHTDH
ncbi:Uncharacterized protein Adt_35052 [Abeliophyllum distichum]|uniref:Uncharacterized protein n=1 Tax=Abeliophyllum distichum TaxID=126358 RepID=A0ABD1QDW2_9LAMI